MLSALFLLLFSIALTSCGGSKGSAAKCASTPKDFVAAMQNVYETKDGGAIYDLMYSKSAEKLETTIKGYSKMAEAYMQALAKMNPEIKKNLGMMKEITSASGRDFYVNLVKLVMKVAGNRLPPAVKFALVKENMSGDKGTITVSAQGRNEDIPVIKEGGCYKIYIPEKAFSGINKMFTGMGGMSK